MMALVAGFMWLFFNGLAAMGGEFGAIGFFEVFASIWQSILGGG